MRTELLKHLLIIGIALPTSFAGYHVMASSGASSGGFTAKRFSEAVEVFSLRSEGYSLIELEVLERDLFRVESRYVEPDRLEPDTMFQGALDRVQRQFAEVMFSREPGGRTLHVSVGSFSTVLQLAPIVNFDGLYKELLQVARVLDDKMDGDTDKREVEYALINGLLSTLDPHSILLPPEAARDMEVDNEGEFGGLGIEITMKDGRLTVKVPLEGTPAFRAGLKPQDQIVRIEEESTINMDLDDAVSKLRGRVGSPVSIMVMRKSFNAPKRFTIVRERIRIHPLEGELLEGDVGYIRIKNFNKHTSRDLQSALTRFHRESHGPLKGLVLDLRMNPGGYLNQAIDVADKFIAEGVIVATEEGATGERAEQRATRKGTEPDYPIAVLVNASSASASEIVAGAIRNNGRGVVIGERTFGKGSIQHLYPHKDTSRLKLTVGKYLTPGDQSIQAIGISPDIRLIPSVVEAPEEADEPDPWGLEPLPRISLYWQDWLEREASLDHSLAQVDEADGGPVYAVRYHLRQEDDADGREPDPKSDWEVGFAKEVVLAAPSSRRADMLRAASRVVARFSEEESRLLESAFEGVGVDWSEGVNPEAPALEVSLDLGEDGVLAAGGQEHIGITVHNAGDAPVFRLSAVTQSDNLWLDEREFYFGRIGPGESRTYRQRVNLHDGYPQEEAPVTIILQDSDRVTLLETVVSVRSVSRPQPRLQYSLKLVDDGSGKSKGNGDGKVQEGERIDLVVTVANVGEGGTSDAFVRAKNRSGKALDLTAGGFEVGVPIGVDGEPCEPMSAGCRMVLPPGETHTERLSFTLKALGDKEAWTVELQVGDNQSYDYGTIQRGGFYEFFQLEETLVLKPSEGISEHTRAPPQIDITRLPAVVSTGSHAILSGKVHDDRGIRDVMIFHDEDKVFYRGGDDATRILPFTVERELVDGANNFYILARDGEGLTTTASIPSLLSTEHRTGIPDAG